MKDNRQTSLISDKRRVGATFNLLSLLFQTKGKGIYKSFQLFHESFAEVCCLLVSMYYRYFFGK